MHAKTGEVLRNKGRRWGTGVFRAGMFSLLCSAIFAPACASSRTKPTSQLVSQRSLLRSAPIEIADPVGRWKTSVVLPQSAKAESRWEEDEKAVTLNVLPGYAHVQLIDRSKQPPSKVNCFVYEQPLHAGEAVDQLLRAIAPGLEFLSFSPLTLSASRGQPHLEFSLEYRPTQEGELPGQAHFLLAARGVFPVVCSTESKLGHFGEARIMREFAEHFEVTQAALRHRYSEIWALDERCADVSSCAAVPKGFRSLTITKQGSDTLYLSQATWFSLSPKATRNRDRVVRELLLEDNSLQWMQWLELYDGVVEFRGQVERTSAEDTTDQSVYRYAFEFRGEVRKGEFRTERPLAGWLREQSAMTSAAPQEALLFYPYLSPVGPSVCSRSAALAMGAVAQSIECHPVERPTLPWAFPDSLCQTWSVSDASESRRESSSVDRCGSQVDGPSQPVGGSEPSQSTWAGQVLAQDERLVFRQAVTPSP